MWTRGKDKNETGKFAIEVFDLSGAIVFAKGGFENAAEADRAAEVEQRAVLFGRADDTEMTDDELLAALGL